MGSRGAGAPTGVWDTKPAHLQQKTDLQKAKPRLLVRRPGLPEVEVKIEKTEFVIGRKAAEVDLVLEDDLVSRRHARLTMDERGYFTLEDLGSQNQIRFGDRPTRRLNLIDGDVFSIGKTEMTFRAEMNRAIGQDPPDKATPAAQPRSPSTDDPEIPEPAKPAKPPADGSKGE